MRAREMDKTTPDVLWHSTAIYVTMVLGRDAPSEQIHAVTVKVYEQMQFLLKEPAPRRGADL